MKTRTGDRGCPDDGGRGGGERAFAWKVSIPPAHFGELAFNARNPQEGTAIAWKVTQRFADGTSREWTPSTKLVAAAQD